MDETIVPVGHRQRNLPGLCTEIFRAEAFAVMLASPEGQAAFAQLDDEHRLALATQHAENLASIRSVIDAIDEIAD